MPPITDTQWGRANWTDYVDNWRELDAEYLQARTVSRFHSATDRDAALGVSPPSGSVVYNETTDRLELRSKLGAWVPLTPLPINMVATADTTSSVAIGHSLASGKGVNFTPANIQITGPLNVLNGVVVVDSPGISIKTGATTATLSTDATSVVSDTPFKLPKLTITGTGVVVDATGQEIRAGTATVTQVAAQNISLSGTLTGGVLNGTSGTIGGAVLATNQVTASAGFIAQSGFLSGDGTKAMLQSKNPSGGALRLGRIELTDRVAVFGAGTDLNSPTAVRNTVVQWFDSGNTLRGDYAVSIYSATDPGAANFPNGTIWFS